MKKIKKLKKSQFGKNLEEVYSDLMDIKIDHKDSFETSMNKFYEVMRKHGICQGQYNENGNRSMITAEWNLCFNTFKLNKLLAFDLWLLLLGETPEDLLGYEYEPKTND